MSPTAADLILMKIVDRSTKKLTNFALFLISTLKFGLTPHTAEFWPIYGQYAWLSPQNTIFRKSSTGLVN